MARARYDKDEIHEAFDCRKYLAEKHGAEPDGEGLYKAPWDGNPLLKVTPRGWNDAAATGRKQDCFALVGNCLGLDWRGKDFATVIRAAADFCGVEPEGDAGDDGGTGPAPTDEEDGMGAWSPSPTGPNNGYVALFRSQATYELLKGDHKAFVLLTFVALRVRWSDGGLNMDGVEVGQAFLGDHREYGMTRGQYREALGRLARYGMLSAIRTTNRGTVVTLGNLDIYDPVMGAGNHQDDQPHGHQATIKQPSGSHQTTTKKKGKTVRRGNTHPLLTKESFPSSEGKGSAPSPGGPGDAPRKGGPFPHAVTGEQAADGGQEREATTERTPPDGVQSIFGRW